MKFFNHKKDKLINKELSDLTGTIIAIFLKNEKEDNDV